MNYKKQFAISHNGVYLLSSIIKVIYVKRNSVVPSEHAVIYF